MKKLLIVLLFALPTIVFGQLPYYNNRIFNLSNIQQGTTAITGFYRTVTFDKTKVPNTDQTNFTVGFTGTLSYLATVANGGKVQNASGFDITFALDSFGNTPCKWEIEQYSPTTGLITAWIKVPSLSHTTNTTIYIKYGNAAISTFQGGASGTAWDGNYYGVYHMGETITGSGQTVADWSGAGLNLTSNGSWTSGQQASGVIGGALQLLNASSDYLQFTATNLSTPYTISGWYNITVADATSFGIGSDIVSTFGNNINWFGTQARLFNGAGSDVVIDATATSINTWTYLSFTRSGTTAIAYHNGASTASTSSGASLTFKYFGRSAGSNTANIKYDELRVSSVARSADWIATEYNNMSSPGTFYTIGAEL